MIKASLESVVDTPDTNLGPSMIEEILVKCISDIDDRIKADLVNFFPGGLEQISELSDDEIKSIITDPDTGYSYVQIKNGYNCVDHFSRPIKVSPRSQSW